MKHIQTIFASAAVTVSASVTQAAIVTTGTTGGLDGALRFNATTTALDTTATSLIVKTQQGTPAENDAANSTNDRLGLVKFPSTSFEASVSAVAIQIKTLGGTTNQFQNQSVYLYGIPEADENISSSTTAGAFPYATGLNSIKTTRDATDLSANRVNDSLLTPLAVISIGATATSTNSILTFYSNSTTNPGLLAFVQANTAGTPVSFILSTDPGSGANTPAFYSSRNTTATAFAPSFYTNADANAVPEPAALSALGLAALVGLKRRRCH